MITETLVFIITSLLAYVCYVHKKIHWKFDKYGVKYLPGYPLFGNIIQSLFLKKHFSKILQEVYNAFPDERYVGYIEGMTPIIMIRDPELIKTVTIKDFDHFVDHRKLFSEDIEPLFGASVFMMKGERWRDMRSTLSPAFTGSKMKQMMPFMTETSQNVIQYLKEHGKENIDVSDVMRRFTNDVIASAGFGIQINSVKEPNNQFYKTARKLFQFGFWQRVKLVTMAFCPWIIKKFKLSIFPKDTTSFFTDLVTSTMDYREKNNVHRPDMIQLLMDAYKGNLKHSQNEDTDDIGFAAVEEHLKTHIKVTEWTMEELTSQVFIFFVAGFETVASTLVFTIHELAINPEVQQKLYQEIREFQEKEGTLTYDNIKLLKYLDSVLNGNNKGNADIAFLLCESLRKWNIAMLDRTCTKAYELPPPHEGGKPYLLKPGDIIMSSAIPIQLDPKYYPEPEKFNPDRFLDENKNNIQPFTFMPFGLGPRNCIGSRFAILEAKVLLYHLVLNFKIVKCEKTADPLVVSPSEQKALGGTWVQMETRV